MKMEWETEYKKLIEEILETGEEIETRNGVRISVMNKILTCDLSEGFPIVTGRCIPFEKIVEEFLWFCAVKQTRKFSTKKGVKIWNANSSKEFLGSIGLTFLKEGDIGPGYGFQLRNFVKCHFVKKMSSKRFTSVNFFRDESCKMSSIKHNKIRSPKRNVEIN